MISAGWKSFAGSRKNFAALEEDFAALEEIFSLLPTERLLTRPFGSAPSGGASRLEIWGQKIEFEIEWIRELLHVSPGLR